ncbi:MAG TPA: LysM peptidoglycan-binding domain-containing protein [Phycisphaerales bacterium]
MTRELKLALIVGFAIVLTVAILVSDHLSKARQATLADVAGVNATRMTAKAPEEPLKSTDELLPATLPASLPAAMSVSDTAPASEHAMLPPSNPTEPVLVQNATAEPAATQSTPLVIGQGSSGLPGSMFTEVPADATYARRNLTEGAPAGGTSSTPALTAKHSPAGDALLENAAEKKNETVTAIKPEAKAETRQALPIGPSDRVHTVSANESLYAIAKRYYGSGNLWRQLAAANVGRVGADGSARLGTKIVIPTKDVLLGKAPADKAAKPASETRLASKPNEKPNEKTGDKAKPDAKTDARTDTKARTYVVKPGDSLGRIASRELGSSKRLAEIAALNKMDPDDDLIAGGTIRLPAR